jgi:hypothetical protein
VVMVCAGCSKLLGINDPVTGDATSGGDGRPDTPMPDAMIDSAVDAPPACAASNTFGSEMAFPIGGTGVAFTVASLDPGGTLDVAIATGNEIVVLHGNGLGTAFGNPTVVATPAIGVAAEDFTADGQNDLISWVADSVVMHERTGGGMFLAPVSLPGTFAAVTNAIADDLLGVPRLDLIVQDDNGRRVFEGSAAASGVSTTAINLGAAGDDLILTDNIDGQGERDVLFVDQAGTVKLSRGLAAVTTIATGATGRAAAIGQLDGQGLRDLVIATPSGGRIFTQGPAGTFTQDPRVIPGVTGDTLVVADINNDGLDDIVAPGSITMQCAGGVYTQVESLSSVAPALLRDLDNDGKPDLLRVVGTDLLVRLQ